VASSDAGREHVWSHLDMNRAYHLADEHNGRSVIPPGMATRDRRLALAAAVLVVGAFIAFLIPFGTCPHGGTYTRLDGHSGCFTSDVGYAATSLIPLKFAIAVGAVVAALALALTALVRRRR
jgi:hypothetical protein